MLLLGFVDDVLDIRWRHKIVLSIIATTPMMLAYDGSTTVLLPSFMHDLPYLGANVDLGILYVIAMALICVFCTNSINILAGVNGMHHPCVWRRGGASHLCLRLSCFCIKRTPPPHAGLEVGQSIVIALSVLIHNVVQFSGALWRPYLISFVLCCPFIACSLALYKFNQYPSKVFVGDSYTYFSGITLAVVAITGHFTKTLMLFFVPQLLNFALSLPQLFGIIPCPRHRVPKWDSTTDTLSPSYADDSKKCINLTLLNAMLVIFGPMKEGSLTKVLLVFQALCSCLAFYVRYSLAAKVYDVVE